MKKVAGFLFFIFSLGLFQPAMTQPTLVDPNVKYQEIEGWGGSLCWWANILGGYSDTDVQMIGDWITDPNGLNMNIFRFNIGGGDDPEHNHMRPDGGAMPGYKASATADFDWTQDENQRRIVKQLIQSRIDQTGENDIILEAFSNSPPYWMTKSGCSAGYFEGGVPNLRDDMYEEFADYLTEVTRYYHDSLGITFHTIEPFNEPYSTWWTAFGGQEGCYFGQKEQEKMIRVLYDMLEEKDMLGYTGISAMDPSSLDQGYNGFVAYKNQGDILPKLLQLNVHSYFGSANSRRNLARFAHENYFRLWQSESGPLNMSGTDQELFLTIAARIVKDIREMKCTAWLDWQLAANQSPIWGILVGNYFQAPYQISRGDGYYYRSQFSRFIKPGYTIIDADSPNTLAALSPDETELVLVIVNETNANKDHSYDLSAFKEINTPVERFRSREVNPHHMERLARTSLPFEGDILEYTAPGYSVTTFVMDVALPDARVQEDTYYIRNKAAGLYAGITNASANAGARLVITGDQPVANASFDMMQDILVGGFSAKPGHLEEASGLVLDVEGNSMSDGARIIQWPDNNVLNQRFHFIHIEDSYFRIMSRSSNKCLCILEDKNQAGAPVVQMTCDDTDNFIWEITTSPVSAINDRSAKVELMVNYQYGTLTVSTFEHQIIEELSIISVSGVTLQQISGIEKKRVSRQLQIKPGMYIVRVTLPDGRMASKLFIAP